MANAVRLSGDWYVVFEHLFCCLLPKDMDISQLDDLIPPETRATASFSQEYKVDWLFPADRPRPATCPPVDPIVCFQPRPARLEPSPPRSQVLCCAFGDSVCAAYEGGNRRPRCPEYEQMSL